MRAIAVGRAGDGLRIELEQAGGARALVRAALAMGEARDEHVHGDEQRRVEYVERTHLPHAPLNTAIT